MTIEPFWVQVNEPTLRQGDYLPGCLVPVPVFDPTTFGKNDQIQDIEVEINEFDLIILNQSCDLENKKVRLVALSPIFSLSQFEEANPILQKRVNGMRY